MDIEPKIKYITTKNNFRIILLISFLINKLIPQKIKLPSSKNEANPKLCRRKSDILLP